MELQINVPKELCSITSRLERAGHSAYFVGGCVRDMLLGKTPVDYDVATSATPQQVTSLFSDCKVIPTGIKHGTVTVIYGGSGVEVTTFRKDGEYSDHRHPKNVLFSDSVREDTARRDFTVNALCYNPKIGVLDFHGGIADLKNGVIRCVGEPDRRFKEDGLRILRALRFASKMGFVIEDETKKAMFSCRELIKCVSAERILSELKGFFSAERSACFISEYFPVIASAVNIKQNIDVKALEEIIKKTNPVDRLAVFFALCGGSVDGAVSLVQGLKPDNLTVKSVMAAAYVCYNDCFGDAVSVAKTLNKHGMENSAMMYTLALNLNKTICADAQQRIKLIKSNSLPLAVKDLAIRGDDLLEKNIACGKDLGRILEHLFCFVHEGAPNTKEVLLTEAVRYMNERNRL